MAELFTDNMLNTGNTLSAAGYNMRRSLNGKGAREAMVTDNWP
jgi:hypothetical protein